MAADDQPASDPIASAEPATPAGDAEGGPAAGPTEATREPAGADGGPAAGPADAGDDPVKARFRDALERKKGRHADGVGGGGPGSGKISDVHSRAGGKRQFRRKSGG
jgi:hypothetical protein